MHKRELIYFLLKHVLRHRGEGAALAIIAPMGQGKVSNLDSALAISAASCGVEFKLPLS